jgi:Holliday junction resolvase-like predicted endonuclease
VENFPLGVHAEKRVVLLLRGYSWQASRTRASRGPFDVIAKSDASTMLVQVKALRTKTALVTCASEALRLLKSRFSWEAEEKLRVAGVLYSACPLACLVNGSRAWFFELTGGDFRLNFEARLPSLQGSASP